MIVLPLYSSLDPSLWSRLPPELQLQVLALCAESSPLVAVRISTLSRAVHRDARVRAALHRSVRLRRGDRLALATLAVSVRDDDLRAASLRNLYICNRIEHADGSGTAGRWDSAALEEQASETTLALATLFHIPTDPAQGEGEGDRTPQLGHPQYPTSNSDREHSRPARGLEWLYPAIKEQGIDDEAEGSQAEAQPTKTRQLLHTYKLSEWPAAALTYIFRRCRNLEHLHVWEPFTFGYP